MIMVYKKARILGLILFVIFYVVLWFIISQFTDVIGIIGSGAAVTSFFIAPKIQKTESQTPNSFQVKWPFGEDNFIKLYKILFKIQS